jgi:hypothetical protein
VGCGEEEKEPKLCEIRGRLPAQEAAVKLLTEAVDIRARSARDLRSKESDNLSHSYVIEIQGSFYAQARSV